MSRIDSPEPPEANPPLRRGRPRPTGVGGFVVQSVRMAWRWLTRMRTALYLLGVLGLATLLATIVPQQPNVPRTVAAWRAGTEGPGEVVSALIDLVGGYDMYGSPVFLAILLLLFTSLTACLIPRVRAWWRIVRRARPPRTAHPGDQEHVTRLTTSATADEVHEAARRLLSERRWRRRSADADPGAPPQVAAEKGHVLREGGSLLFHLSFYVLLIAIVLNQLLSFTGQVGIVEGDDGWTDTPVGYWTQTPGRWWDQADHPGFTMTLDRFDVDWFRDPAFGGQPKTFLSHVTVRHADGTVTQDTVGGNDPLIVDGMKIHQLDWGYAPRVVVEQDGEVVHDAFLVLTATEEGVWHGAAKAPAADPDVGLDLFLVPYAPPDEQTGQPQITGAPWADAPLLLFASYTGDLRLEAAQGVNTLDLTGLEEGPPGALRPGDEMSLPGGVTVRFPELRRWVGFQVSRRPVLPLLFTGAVLVLLGLIPALYAYRRRLWIVARPYGDGSTVTVAGRAFQRSPAFDREFDHLVGALRERLAAADAEPRPDPTTPTEAVRR